MERCGFCDDNPSNGVFMYGPDHYCGTICHIRYVVQRFNALCGDMLEPRGIKFVLPRFNPPGIVHRDSLMLVPYNSSRIIQLMMHLMARFQKTSLVLPGFILNRMESKYQRDITLMLSQYLNPILPLELWSHVIQLFLSDQFICGGQYPTIQAAVDWSDNYIKSHMEEHSEISMYLDVPWAGTVRECMTVFKSKLTPLLILHSDYYGARNSRPGVVTLCIVLTCKS
jgi:hypothetical protein